MLLTVTAVAVLAIGWDLTLLVWKREEALPSAERALLASLFALVLWLASTWMLAFAGFLVRPAMIARTTAFVVAATLLRYRAGRRHTAPAASAERRGTAVLAVALVPIVLWSTLILWRSAIVPPLSHDALSYHLPKAAMYIQAHHYRSLRELSFAFGPRPSNYELLLADAILLDGDDTWTEWVSTLFYLLFIVASVALAQRWWGDDPLQTAGVALATAGIPVLLLHAGAHKNDVMTSYFLVAAMVAAGRWIASQDLRGLVAAVLALEGAAGTKTFAPMFAVCLAPFLLRGLTARRAATAALVAAIAFPLLGGIHYLERFAPAMPAAAAATAPSNAGWGDWANLWNAPWVLLTQPFVGSAVEIVVPWDGVWRWPAYELYFSHLGAPFAIGAIFLPVAVIALRRRGSEGTRRERRAVSVATLAAFLLLLPVRYVPYGLYVTYLPRFVLFIVPPLFAWTVAPALLWCRESRERARGALAVAVLTFVSYAVTNTLFDLFVPPRYVLWARQHPGTRVIATEPNRPASLVDRVAGPFDTVAIECGGSTWIYPAFGARLTRHVELLPPPHNGRLQVPEDAKWVVIDRAWHMVWGDPGFRKLSDFEQYLGLTRPTAEDLAVLEQLRRDPRFRTVYMNRRVLGAVFVRVGR